MKRYHVYKIVHKHYDGTLRSMIVSSYNEFCVEYKLKIYAKAKIGKLFAFKDIDCARDFSDRAFIGKELWECLTTKKPILCDFRIASVTWSDILNRYWKDDFSTENIENYYKTMAPIGTVLCDDLKLWRRIS